MPMVDCPLLPATGSGTSGWLTLLAIVVIIIGLGLLVATRRRGIRRAFVIVVAISLGSTLLVVSGSRMAMAHAQAVPCPTTTTVGAPASTTTGAASTAAPTTTVATSTTTSTTTTSTTITSTTTTTTSTTTTTTLPPIPPQAVSQTVIAAEVVSGSLIDDGDSLGDPPASITGLNAVQGPGALSFGVPTEVGDVNGRPCGTITVAADGGYTFAPALPGPRECTIEYTLANAGGTSTASETFQVT
jgi:LPXTG-motif cell wall-anchored protein